MLPVLLVLIAAVGGVVVVVVALRRPEPELRGVDGLVLRSPPRPEAHDGDLDLDLDARSSPSAAAVAGGGAHRHDRRVVSDVPSSLFGQEGPAPVAAADATPAVVLGPLADLFPPRAAVAAPAEPGDLAGRGATGAPPTSPPVSGRHFDVGTDVLRWSPGPDTDASAG